MIVKLSPSEENTLKTKGYRLIKFIGEGAYSKVFLTEFGSPTEQNVIKSALACKIINASKAPKDFVVKFLPRELDVLIRINHPHLIYCHSIFQRKNKYYMFMRYTENGDLLGYIMKHGAIGENQSRIWVHQMSLGIEYLHELEIVHRDLKCENILVTQNLNVKLSDFGFARFCVDDSDAPALSETYCGSLSYAAPEILRGQPYALKPVDIWSFGVILYVMLNRSMPFDDHGLRKLYEDQMCKRWKIKPRVAHTLSAEVKKLMKKVLEPDPGLRYKIGDVVHSSWIAMDSRLAGMTIVEAAALKRAKEERKKLSETRRSFVKATSTILHYSPNEVRQVYLANYQNLTKSPKVTILACKIIDTQKASKDFVKRFLPRELEMLVKINHPHIVHTHSIFQRKTKYFIFMRYMELGDLLDYILHNGVVSEDQARIWMRQISLGIQYLHELDIAHRDVKCENCLLSQNLNVKLSDFGFARSCVDDKMRPIFSSTFCGSLSYTAPEILQGLPYAPKPTDIWSMGIVFFVMLNRALPFDDKHIKTLYTAQIGKKWRFRTNVSNVISQKCKKLIAHMMEPNPLHRIKIDKVISSDWIAMDSRLLVWTDQELMALRKAQESKKKELERVEFGNVRKSLLPTKESFGGSGTMISAKSSGDTLDCVL